MATRKFLNDEETPEAGHYREWAEDQGYNPSKPKQASNDVDLGWFESQLRIDKHNLDEEFVRQPELMQRASSRYAMAISIRDEAKDKVKQVEAEIEQNMRDRQPEGRGVTDKAVKAMVDAHPRRKQAVEAYVASVREAAEWEGMFESFKNRGFALTELVKLFLADYYSRNTATNVTHESKRQEYEQADSRRREAYRGRQLERP